MYIEFEVTIKKHRSSYTSYNDQIRKEFSIDLPDEYQQAIDIGSMANAVVAAAIEAYRNPPPEEKEE